MPSADRRPVSIVLSTAQVEQVIRAAGGTAAGGGASRIRLLARGEPPATATSDPAVAQGAGGPTDWQLLALQGDERRLSRSLLRGLALLTCFEHGREERGVVDLAAELGMSASTAHRYAQTLLELGLLERCPRTRKYRLARP